MITSSVSIADLLFEKTISFVRNFDRLSPDIGADGSLHLMSLGAKSVFSPGRKHLPQGFSRVATVELIFLVCPGVEKNRSINFNGLPHPSLRLCWLVGTMTCGVRMQSWNI